MDTAEKKTLYDEYLGQLSEKEKMAYEIAKSHLKSSFSLERSIGFIEWLKKKEEQMPSDKKESL
jgi:hypothetical protein